MILLNEQVDNEYQVDTKLAHYCEFSIRPCESSAQDSIWWIPGKKKNTLLIVDLSVKSNYCL